jgi:type I restriction enzyme M protein
MPMNMLLHGVKDSEFEIYHGDSLTNDWDILRELNPAKKPYFDVIVANPPFSETPLISRRSRSAEKASQQQ